MLKRYSFHIKPIANMGNVIVERIVFHFKGKIQDGYLHLLEHLWVRSNRVWLENFESNLNIFNAMTEKNKITFVFIYVNNSVDTNELNFDLEFNEQDFLIEKNTISEERKLYKNDVKDVDTILGSIDVIENFNLSVLVEMMKEVKYDMIRFIFSSDFQKDRHLSYFSFMVDKDAIKWKNSNVIEISNSKDFKILLAILQVFRITNETFYYTYNEVDNHYEIVVENYEIFNYMVSHKENVLKRYQLLLSNLQLEVDQTIYLFDLFGLIPNILELWLVFDWEVLKS